jgi:outer membrane protein TolC
MTKNLLFIPLLLVLYFLTTADVVAQYDDSLIYKYRKMAVEYYQKVKIAEQRLSRAESQLDRSKADFLPKIDFLGSYKYYGVPMELGTPDPNTPSAEIHQRYSLDLVITQPIFMGGSVTNTKNAAASLVDVMKSLVNVNRQDVMQQSDVLYLQAVSKNELHTLMIKYRESIDKFLKVVQDRVDEEIVGMNELYQTKVRYNDAEFSVIKAKKELRVSIMNLNRLIGLSIDTTIQINDTLAITKWQKPDTNIVALALAQRPEVGYYSNQIKMREYQEKITAANYNPQLYIQGRGKWGSPSPGLLPEPAFNYNLSANISIPIFYWGRRAYDVSTKQAKTEIAKLKLDDMKQNIRLEVGSAYYELDRTQKQLDFTISSLDNAKKNVDVYLDRYNEGLASVLEVLDAQLYWEKTYYNYVLSKYQLNIAYTQYQRALGNLTVK